MTTLEWQGENLCEGQIQERQFVVNGGKSPVPGILWAPEDIEKPVPLVLFGHGGSGHKRVARSLMLGRRFASVSQFAMAAIDGPAHGDRKRPGGYNQSAAMSDGGVKPLWTAWWKTGPPPWTVFRTWSSSTPAGWRTSVSPWAPGSVSPTWPRPATG